MQDTAGLGTVLVGDISGGFYIPSYQRGYRWEPIHIRMLLSDIYDNGSLNYCLQPIVVKPLECDRHELVDGQQRLTSIYLILKYMKQILPFVVQKFSLSYETRPQSERFLETIDDSLADSNVDFFHMSNAYREIERWFNDGSADKSLKAINLYKYLSENVQVIWYEVDNNIDSIELFTRLNIGKIPLTNAELVKALFLSKDTKDLTDEKQIEIATSWDTIEKQLHNNDLWCFLTNEDPTTYQTRIELIFNLIANKHQDEKESFFTFFYFSSQMKEQSKVEVWKMIEEYFYILWEWYENRDMYHKVGYLVASGCQIQKLKTQSESLTKSAFHMELDKQIRDALDLSQEQFSELSYESKKDRARIENLLLLFNVETVRLLQDSTEKYCFTHHKRSNWSLEHIHAQNSEGLNREEDQKIWLEMHRKSLADLAKKEALKNDAILLIQDIDDNYDKITQAVFDSLFGRVTSLLSESQDKSYVDLVSNMALLSSENNAALNNSTFDVKRNKILEMDRNGKYIPICTKRVFLKYYSDSEHTQLQFWGEYDRKAYIDAMIGKKGVLTPYLKDTPIEVLDEH